MPTYAYACTQCGHHFEVRQSFSDDALSDCPECDGRLRKLFNAVGVVFKGSGFYRTDSRSGSSSSVPGSTGGAGSSSGTTSAPSSSGGESSAASSSGAGATGAGSAPAAAAS